MEAGGRFETGLLLESGAFRSSHGRDLGVTGNEFGRFVVLTSLSRRFPIIENQSMVRLASSRIGNVCFTGNYRQLWRLLCTARCAVSSLLRCASAYFRLCFCVPYARHFMNPVTKQFTSSSPSHKSQHQLKLTLKTTTSVSALLRPGFKVVSLKSSSVTRRYARPMKLQRNG